MATAAILLLGCAQVATLRDDAYTYESTYLRKLASAERGDAEAQNAVGFMLYRGDGVAADRLQAQLWFERAAAQGNARARRNLAYIAASAPQLQFSAKAGADSPEGPARAGERAYLKFCSGCHGTDGVAEYENSPSFAFGERLHKSDAALMASLLDGRQEMPGWEGKLPRGRAARDPRARANVAPTLRPGHRRLGRGAPRLQVPLRPHGGARGGRVAGRSAHSTIRMPSIPSGRWSLMWQWARKRPFSRGTK